MPSTARPALTLLPTDGWTPSTSGVPGPPAAAHQAAEPGGDRPAPNLAAWLGLAVAVLGFVTALLGFAGAVLVAGVGAAGVSLALRGQSPAGRPWLRNAAYALVCLSVLVG